MTAPICRVPNCDHPIPDAWVCQRCARTLEQALGDIPATIHQLNITLTKGGRFADRNERCGAETPLPLDLRASEALDELAAHLTGWAGTIAHQRGIQPPTDLTQVRAGNPRAITVTSRWMLHHVEWLRHFEHGHDCIDEITTDVRIISRIIDRPPERWYAGPCVAGDCGADLYAAADKGNVNCRDCGATYDVAARRAWLLTEAEDVLATSTEICRALTTLAGVELTGASIRSYVHRGRVAAHGIRDGKPVFRLGDIIEVVMAQATTRQAG